MEKYLEFLEGKRIVHQHSGFDVEIDDLPNWLFPFQKFVVKRSLAAGKYAIFSGTGTGKMRMELAWCERVGLHTDKPVLFLAPLGVSGQIIKEGKNVGVEVRRMKDFKNDAKGIFITNYEQLDNIAQFIYLFGGVCMDESSIIKSEEGVTTNRVIELFSNTPFKLCGTATPSPNDPMELGNHAEFLDVMSYNVMLAMYFVHDGGETSKWRVKGHARRTFWQWVSTWAIMFQHPKDILFEQDGYDLPPLNLVEKQIITEKRDNGLLFNDVAVSATNFNKELRLTKVERLDTVAEIVNASDEKFVIWIKQNEEEKYLKRLIPEAVIVTGSDAPEYKEEMLLGFADGKYRVLITKTKIAGMGLNFQVCHNTIYASPDFSWEAVFQSLRRFLRYGQTHTVNAWLITTDTMTNVIQTFLRKQKQFQEMQAEMTAATNENLHLQKSVKPNRKFEQYKTSKFMYQLGDCVQLIQNVPRETIGMSIFSPPFPTLYVYSDEIEDMGNCKDFNEFFTSFNFLVPELNRVMIAGRHVIVHCMDVPIQKGKEGYIGLRDFSGMIIDSFQKSGFIYHSRVTLWKNPVTEMQRTKALGLLHKQVKKDAAMCRVGIPDYLLIFRKAGENPYPIVHQDKDPSKPNYLPVDLWQKYASPVWMDIDYGNTLNGRDAREEEDERHIAPLQLDTINRALHLWSNEDDTILTPYAGIGSELYESIKLKRNAIGFELKKSYFDEGVNNCIAAEESLKQNKLFAY
jgi:DNA modification methylase